MAVVDGRRISCGDLRNGRESFSAEELTVVAADSDLDLACAALTAAQFQASGFGIDRLRTIVSAFISVHGVSSARLLGFPLRAAEQIEVLRCGWASLSADWLMGRFLYNSPTCRVLEAVLADPGNAYRPYSTSGVASAASVPFGLDDIRFYTHELALIRGPSPRSLGTHVNLETVKSIPNVFQPNNQMSAAVSQALREKYRRREFSHLNVIVEVLTVNWTGSVAELESTANAMLGPDVR